MNKASNHRTRGGVIPIFVFNCLLIDANRTFELAAVRGRSLTLRNKDKSTVAPGNAYQGNVSERGKLNRGQIAKLVGFAPDES